MPVIDLSAYKPVPATLGDANQIANGMQAIQNVVNALDNLNFAAGRIFDPAKLMQNAAIDGDPLAWDNTLVKWVPASTLAAGRPRAPRVVVSTMAGGPPASPVDGDIWVATSVDANGTRWAFQYNAGSASAFKWEFIGGPPVVALVATAETTASGAYVDLATVGPSIVVARAGDYDAAHAGWLSNSAVTGTSFQSPKPGAGAAIDQNGIAADIERAGAAYAMALAPVPMTGLAAGDTVKVQYRVGGGTGTFSNRRLAVTPVRIS